MDSDATLRAKALLNGTGCQFGAVTRERVDDLEDNFKSLRGLLCTILIAIVVQIFVFMSATFWFFANRVVP